MVLYQVSGARFAQCRAEWQRAQVGGYLGRREIQVGLAGAGISQVTPDDLQAIIDLVSVDPRGITFQAFIDFVSQNERTFRDADEELRQAFRIFDQSGTGTLTKKDIGYVFKKLGLSKRIDFEEAFDSVDTNNDGVIDYEEFSDLMKRKHFPARNTRSVKNIIQLSFN